VRAYSDPDIQRWHVRTMDVDEAREWITARALRWNREHGADWVVQRRGNPVGRAGLRTIDLDEGRAELTGFHRLDLHHSVANRASCRVAVKCGYEVEGTARRAVLHSDGWHDMHLHPRIEPDTN